MFGYHAPLWYLLYWPLEATIDVFQQRLKRWLQKTILKHKQEVGHQNKEENVVGKCVVITGANSGIGKHTAIEMATRGSVVVMGCRDLEKGEQARKEILEYSDMKTVESYRLDLSDLDSVRQFAAEVLRKHPVIDILINNAGICVNHTVQLKSKEGWDLSMISNHLGHFLLTNLLIHGILASDLKRVVAVSSSALIPASLDPEDLMMENCQDLGIWNTKPYQNSKLALSLFTKMLGIRYPSIKIYSMCPGFADTVIFEKFEMRPVFKVILDTALSIYLEKVEVGVETVLMCALGKSLEGGPGAFYRFGKRIRGIENMLKEELAEQIWIASENLVGMQQSTKVT